jgi:hypothetical protein
MSYVPIEDGNPNTSEFGYAGSSSINTVNFVHNALHTENGQQFIAYYYRHATSTTDTNNNRIVIARRNSNTNVWEMFFTTFTANSITDGHDVAAFGIDGDGYMHLSWGMHGDAFHYAKTTTSVFGTNAIVFGPDTTMTGRENSVTYPQWLRMPNGDLLYLFREGASGNGDTFLNRYYVASQTWSNVHVSGTHAVTVPQRHGLESKLQRLSEHAAVGCRRKLFPRVDLALSEAIRRRANRAIKPITISITRARPMAA